MNEEHSEIKTGTFVMLEGELKKVIAYNATKNQLGLTTPDCLGTLCLHSPEDVTLATVEEQLMYFAKEVEKAATRLDEVVQKHLL
jgi:hypothetical protein